MTVFVPLKRYVDPNRPITYGIVQAGEDVEDGIPYVRPIDMDGHKGVPDVSALRRTTPDIARSYRRSEVRPGDLIVSIGPSYGKTMVVPESLAGANLTQGTARVAPAAHASVRFLRWALRSNLAMAHWDAAVGGATFRALNLEPLAETPVPYLSEGHQRSIADYLDAETARIDALIAKKRRLIELLDERRNGLRERLLSDGRRAGVVVRLGVLVREIDERLGVGEVPPLLSVSIHRGVVPFTEANPDRLPRADDLDRYKVCERGDLVLNRMRAFQGGIGRAAVRGIVSPDYSVLRPTARADSGYLNHVLRSPWFVGQMESRLRGIGGVEQGNVRTPRVNWDDLRTIAVPAPPLAFQTKLAEALDMELTHSLAIQELIEGHVSLIEEHRQALITAAVTGELGVGEAVA